MASRQSNRLTLVALGALIVLALVAPWIPGGESKGESAERAELQSYIATRETQLIAAEQRHDWAYIDSQLTANFQEIGGDGRLYTKKEIAALFPQAELLDYQLSDMKVEPVAVNVFLVTYTGDFNARFQGKGGPMRARLSTLWVRDADYQYKARFHQVVPIAIDKPGSTSSAGSQ